MDEYVEISNEKYNDYNIIIKLNKKLHRYGFVILKGDKVVEKLTGNYPSKYSAYFTAIKKISKRRDEIEEQKNKVIKKEGLTKKEVDDYICRIYQGHGHTNYERD